LPALRQHWEERKENQNIPYAAAPKNTGQRVMSFHLTM